MDGTELAISNIRKFNNMYSMLSRSDIFDAPYSEMQQVKARQAIPILLTANNSKSNTVADILHKITLYVIDAFSLPTFNNKYYIDKIGNISDKIQSRIGSHKLEMIFGNGDKSLINEKDVDAVIETIYQVMKVLYELIDDSKKAVQAVESKLNS